MKKKKVTWNAGQTAERHSRPRLPPYMPLPDIADPKLQLAWDEMVIGGILLTTVTQFIRRDAYYQTIPHPMMISGDSGWGEKNVPIGASMIYLGTTDVDCQANKGRIISLPYPTVFYEGARYLIQNPNHFKPLE